MTLGTAMSMFRFISRVPVKDMGDGLVVEALNSGWRYAANDAKLSLFGYYKRSLTYGVSEYSLPTTITKIHRVRLLDGAVCMAEMIPSAAEDVLGRDATAEMTPGTPESCSVAFCKFEDGTSGWLLKFNCPVNWGGANLLEVFVTRDPAYISDATKEPDIPVALHDAGLYRAAYMATLEPRIDKLFKEAMVAYLKGGAGLEPRPPLED
jgi:hypothetical protein